MTEADVEDKIDDDIITILNPEANFKTESWDVISKKNTSPQKKRRASIQKKQRCFFLNACPLFFKCLPIVFFEF